MNKIYKVEMMLTFGEMVALMSAASAGVRVRGGFEDACAARHRNRWYNGVSAVSALRVALTNAIAPRHLSACDSEWSQYWLVVSKWDSAAEINSHALYECGRRIAAARKEVA